MTTQHRSTKDTVAAFFDAFGAADIPAVTALFAQDINFTVHGSPNTPWVGHRSHRDELAAFFAAFNVLGEPSEYAVEHIVVDAEHAVALGHNAFPVIDTGKSFTNHFALQFTVTDGLITGYQMYEDTYAIHQAFTPPTN